MNHIMDNEQRASLCLSIEKPSEFQLAVSADLYRIWHKYLDWLHRYGALWKMSNVSVKPVSTPALLRK